MQYVSKSPQPLFPRQMMRAPSWESVTDSALHEIETGRIGGPSYENLDHAPSPPPVAHLSGTTLPIGSDATATSNPEPNRTVNNQVRPPKPSRRESQRRDGPPRGRFPPTTPALLPQHRWCSKCEIIKPHRAHHCRICGTVRN
jgi:palmitoyltransferase